MLQFQLTPNQIYLLNCIRTGVTPININFHMEFRSLKNGGWLEEDNNLSPKSKNLLTEIESLLEVQSSKKKITTQTIGLEFSESVQKYLELFPKMKLPSGKMARSDKRNIETNFKWFFEHYSYPWETILKATAMYVDEYERKSPAYMYMRTSQYFIKKMEQDKTIHSELADYCSNIESGTNTTTFHFSDTVV